MSASATIEALRRGWCPGTLRPMETGDGWLVRLHPPGGRLSPEQLRRVAALARAHGSGLVEISARANLQIRGVTADSHPRLVQALLAERLVDEHDGDGPQRLALISPLAGTERCAVDAVALAGAIETAARPLRGLPAKLGIVLDDGGPLSLDAFPADIRLRATAPAEIRLGLPAGLWFGPITAEDAPGTVAGLLSGFLAHHRQRPGAVRRFRDLSRDALVALASAAGLQETVPPPGSPLPRRVGSFAWGEAGRAVVVGLPFGRCDAETLDRLAAACGADADIRFSPWRGIAFRGLRDARAATLLSLASKLGLVTEDADPRLSVQACAGAPACKSAQAPAMTDAARLAEAVPDLLATGMSLHVSGCIKGCAHPGPADLTLVAEDGRYRVIAGGTARESGGEALDLPTLLARLQPGEELHARLSAARRGMNG